MSRLYDLSPIMERAKLWKYVTQHQILSSTKGIIKRDFNILAKTLKFRF